MHLPALEVYKNQSPKVEDPFCHLGRTALKEIRGFIQILCLQK